ncbi:hypothetical protein CLIB1444_02S02036 [[Candida] jaroonii]|uniref:Uncharacterized protein n=1 Tax=[Candida] jaroonii TaxID=467808 RepID=A0ACA9Y2G9_9ASCO|nr:hypothetical protein CLIB1444_02S02036 [[Candida] jaroonii]
MFKDQSLGIAASVFLALFVLYTVNSVFIIMKNGLKSRFTSLGVYGLIRIGGQIAGIGFAINGFSNTSWFIAYIILGAEGFIMLIVGNLIFLINEHNNAWGSSYLTKKFIRGIKGKMGIDRLIHLLVIPANVCIIYSGVLLSKDDLTAADAAKSKSLRTAGVIILLAQIVLISAFTLHTFFVAKLRNPVMYCLLFIMPFILMRGIYGILAVYVPSMNYFSYETYLNGNKTLVTIFEYVLGTTMEFITALTLMNTHWIKRYTDPKVSASNSDESLEKDVV